MWKRFLVKKNERALELRDGDFVALLGPGEYRRFDPWGKTKLEVLSLERARFDHALEAYLRRAEPALIEANFVRVDLADNEVGLRFEDNVLAEVIPPSARRLYWREPAEQRIEVVNLSETYDMDPALVGRLDYAVLSRSGTAVATGVVNTQIQQGCVGVLRVNGAFVRLLPPGPAAFWRFGRDVQVSVVDVRWQLLDVAGQEILTRDKVALRLNLSAQWRFVDVLQAFSTLEKPADYVYRELQLALRAAVGTRTLDELLENKEIIDRVVMTQVAPLVTEVGIELGRIGVKDIVLPGDMKALLARVVEAEKAAQANVIRRREETAATRSLLNTARVMEDNPIAMRMKELESLERIAERVGSISVVGGLDQLLGGLVKLLPEARTP